MNSSYKEMFKVILKAYYDGKFEEQIQELLNTPGADKVELSRSISYLCGVKVEYSENYVNDLKHALKNYNPSERIVNKVSDCPVECITADGKALCEASCPFNAIIVDKKNHLVSIDDTKCADCGFCIEACPNNVLMDRVEFIPLVNYLKEENC